MQTLQQGFSIGPFGFSLGMALLALGIAAALIVGLLLGRRHELAINDGLINLLLVSLVGARIVFVLRYLDSFGSIIEMMDIRDRGFDPIGALAAGMCYLAWMAWKDRKRLRPALLASSVGLATWGLAVAVTVLIGRDVEMLPDLALTSPANEIITLAALGPDQNKPMVVNLWATWCPPCRREMPTLERAQKTHADVSFVFINQGEEVETAMGYLESQGLNIDQVMLDVHNQFGTAVGIRVLPTTLFYDRTGRLRAQHVGELSTAGLNRQLDRMAVR